MTRPEEKRHLYDPTGQFYAAPEWVLMQAGRDRNEVVWLPAVSTILDIYQHPGLRNWYGRVGIVKAEQIRDQAGLWGSQAHSLIEYMMKGNKIDPATWAGIPDPVKNSLRAWVRWLQVTKFKPAQAEMVVYSLKYGYAGTLDAIGQFGKLWGMADWKTGKGLFPSALGFMQMAAYHRAFHETYPAHPRIRQARLVGLNRETGDFQQGIRSATQITLDWHHFTYAMKLWRYIKAPSDVEAREQAIREKGGTNAEEEKSQGPEATRGQEGNGAGRPLTQAAA